MLNQQLALSKLSRQVVRVDINVDFELFGNRILYVLVQLAVVLQESDLVWETLTARSRYLLHEHKDFVDARYVLLHLAQIVGQHRSLHSLS
jgi:hypothetical protein